jgi:putative ABC transport system ATP-binding protein
LFDYAKKNQATLIVVTHDQDLADKCDMQIFIKDGKIEHIDKQQPKKPTKAVKKPLSARRRMVQ